MRRILIPLCFLLAAFAGCGSQLGATVSGKVTLDGAPLTSGDVMFTPTGKGPAAGGSIDSSGSYQLATGTDSGLPPGEYKVTVVATKPAPPAAANQPPPAPIPITPPKYGRPETTDLKVTVAAGSNTIDLTLKSN
jgi:hypothetical protein